jgi:hypothetical protein
MDDLRPARVRARRSAWWQSGGAVADRRSRFAMMAGLLLTPFAVVGYLGVAGLLVLPLLSLRVLVPRRRTLLTVRA